MKVYRVQNVKKSHTLTRFRNRVECIKTPEEWTCFLVLRVQSQVVCICLRNENFEEILAPIFEEVKDWFLSVKRM